MTCSDPTLTCGEDNLCMKAARAFFRAYGTEGGCSIRLEKKLPREAGLGGGSADAAAVLRALNRLCGEPFSTEELCAIGAKIGADVPFCVKGQGAALAEGIGEILTPCRGLSERFFVTVACGGEGVSTPEAYGALDSMYGNFAKPRAVGAHFAPLHAALATDDLRKIGTHMFNIFEQAVLPTHSVAPRLLTAMRESGSVAAMMSGSGPSVFGLFAEEAMARTAAERIGNDLGIRAFVTRPVNCYDD